MLTAELGFVRDLAARIRSGTLGGTEIWRRMHELLAEGMRFEEILADPVGHLGEEAARPADRATPSLSEQTPDRCGNTGQGPYTRAGHEARPEAHSSR